MPRLHEQKQSKNMTQTQEKNMELAFPVPHVKSTVVGSSHTFCVAIT